MKHLTILVTGGAGFIGSHIVDCYIKEGFRVVVIDNLSTGNKKNINKKAIFYQMDLKDQGLDRIFKKEKIDYVNHHAAHISVQESLKNPLKNAKENIENLLRLLECCRKYHIKKFIFASTGGAIYGKTNQIPTNEKVIPTPQSPYGISKLACEYYVRFYGEIHRLPYVILRYANVYGPRQYADGEGGVIAIFIKKITQGESPVIYGDGEQTRDYVYVSDISEANFLALKIKGNHVLNIGTEKETTVNELLKKIKKELQKNIHAKNANPLPGEVRRSCLENSKAKKYIQWTPQISLEEGIRRTIKGINIQ